MKFSDVSGTGTALAVAGGSFTTPGPTFLLNGLVPDSTATGRIGRKIVMKSLYEVTSSVAVQGEYATQLIRFKKNLNLETMFNAGTAGTIGDITSGSVYIMFAQNGTIGTAAPTVNWRSRIRYTDN